MNYNDPVYTFNVVISLIAILFGIGGLIWAYFEYNDLKRLDK